MTIEPDWTAAVAESRRWLESDPDSAQMRPDVANLARCILAALKLVHVETVIAPVEWVDGRATVGDVTVQMSRWSGVYQGTELPVIHVARIEHGGADVHVEHPDEATAKRIAIAVAREMQR